MADLDMNLTPDRSAADFDYETIETGYYDRVFHKRAGIQSKWHHLKFAAIRDRIAPASRHLDIACGPGTFIGTISETVDSTGIDIAATQIEYARSAYGSDGKKFEIVKPGRFPYDDGAFDIATCVELLEHLTPTDGQALLVEAKRVIRPGGTLLLTTPDYGGGWPILEWILNRTGDVSYEDQHITHFTRSRLKLFLEQAGFEDVKVDRYQFLAPFVAPFGWAFADRFAEMEPRWLTSRLGFLLFATATPGAATRNPV
jgi:2-polyprenyl-3-methyl-5-hydroxy-6-metoxy-1,4-benzoquinol methylase